MRHADAGVVSNHDVMEAEDGLGISPHPPDLEVYRRKPLEWGYLITHRNIYTTYP